MKLKAMNEIDTAFNTVLKDLEEWENYPEERSYMRALELQAHLTIIRFLAGAQTFDELPYFKDKLQEATMIVKEHWQLEYPQLSAHS